MSRKFLGLLILILLVVLCGSCAEKVNYDLRGTWKYTSLDTEGNFYDEGTITFEGNPAKGDSIRTNYYKFDYGGKYSVNDNSVIIMGDEVWRGSFFDGDQLRGTWKAADDSARGTWTAVRND